MNATFRYPPLVSPVVSIEYEIAKELLQSMFQKGLIKRQEYERIDSANIRTFIGGESVK